MHFSPYQGYYIHFELGHITLKVFICMNQTTFNLHQGLLGEILEEFVEELATGSKNSLMSFETVTYKERQKFWFRLTPSLLILQNKCRCREWLQNHPAYKSIPAAYSYFVCLLVTWDTTAASLSHLMQTLADITDLVEALQLNQLEDSLQSVSPFRYLSYGKFLCKLFPVCLGLSSEVLSRLSLFFCCSYIQMYFYHHFCQHKEPCRTVVVLLCSSCFPDCVFLITVLPSPWYRHEHS